MSVNPFHSNDVAGWITPPWVVELTRKVFGSIDLDPASSPAANLVIQATKIYTVEDDGLNPENEWEGVVLLNAPGHCGFGDKTRRKENKNCGVHCGVYSAPVNTCTCKVTRLHLVCEAARCTCKLVKRFWQRMNDEFSSGRVVGMYVGYSLQQLQYLPRSLRFPILVPSKRMDFIDPTTMEPKGSPQHGNYLACMGEAEHIALFKEHAREFGEVR